MAQSSDILRIGTRGSPLALTQAGMVRDALVAAGCDPASIAVEVIRTTGDAIQDRPLADAGGKGLFTKEIEEALLARRIDVAVHSAKDVPTFLPAGLTLAGCLPREDAREAFISHKGRTIADLPAGASVGTSSPRREALVRWLRPDLKVVLLRGNVETRLRKLEEGVADATILALAGLKRLRLESRATSIMGVDEFLPPAGQGIIALETRLDDERTRRAITAIDHAETTAVLACERAFLGVLDGTCRTPIAAHAVVEEASIQFRGLVAKPDGSMAHDIAAGGHRGDAEKIGAEAGREIKSRIGPGFF